MLMKLVITLVSADPTPTVFAHSANEMGTYIFVKAFVVFLFPADALGV